MVQKSKYEYLLPSYSPDPEQLKMFLSDGIRSCPTDVTRVWRSRRITLKNYAVCLFAFCRVKNENKLPLLFELPKYLNSSSK
jgi:hypothetical protein